MSVQDEVLSGLGLEEPGRSLAEVEQPLASRALGLGRRHGPLLLVLGSFAISCLIVPILAPVPISDDWVYARSVQLLVQQHVLHTLPLSVATLLFQVIWGGLFAAIFGFSFGILRVATVVLFLTSGVAFYALGRELALSRAASALGTALYLFNPLAFVLSFTFMTDSYFTALSVIALYLFARSLRSSDSAQGWWMLAGSAVAAITILERQLALVIPVAVLTYLVLTRRLLPNRQGLFTLLRIVGLPFLAVVAYYAWARLFNGIPEGQGWFYQALVQGGVRGGILQVSRVTFITAIYLGLFALPLVALVLPVLHRLLVALTTRGWLLLTAWIALIAAGLGAFNSDHRLMPYIPHFLNDTGLGPNDLIVARRPIVGPPFRIVLTLTCAAAAILLGLTLVRRLRGFQAPDRSVAGLVLAFGVWQFIASLPPSFEFRTWTINGLPAPSLDRYLLPLLPITIALTLWAMRGLAVKLPLSWLLAAALAVFAVVGTRDSLVFHETTWQLDEYANSIGISNLHLDGGATWDGWHLYDYSMANHVPPQTPNGPWWINLFGPATDSQYVVSALPLPGYDVVKRVDDPLWLKRAPEYLYLLHKQVASSP